MIAAQFRDSKRILTLLIGVVVLIAVLTPEPPAETGPLTTRSTAPFGARVAYDLAERLGWHPERRTEELLTVTDSVVVHVVLDPQDMLAAAEVHALLENVRRGGGLFVSGDIAPLDDSLGYSTVGLGPVTPAPATGCPPGPGVLASALRMPSYTSGVIWRRPPPDRPQVLLTARNTNDEGRRDLDAMVAFQYGRGRIVIAGNGTVLANDVMRQCSLATDVAYVRALEFLRGAGASPDRLVFDEYHHGEGAHPGSFGAVWHYATRTPSGHLLLQGAIGLIILLLAAAPRPVKPRDPERIARRSPIEHADALANAYEKVQATRTVTSRLLSGVRRRAGYTRTGQTLDDDGFLQMVGRSWPAVREDTDAVRRALKSPIKPRDMPPVARALARIEAALTRPPTVSTH